MCENTHVFEVQKVQFFLQENYVLLVVEIMLTLAPIGACSFESQCEKCNFEVLCRFLRALIPGRLFFKGDTPYSRKYSCILRNSISYHTSG